MQSRPNNWAAVFAVPHITEYRFLIGGSEYRESDIQGTPIIESLSCKNRVSGAAARVL